MTEVLRVELIPTIWRRECACGCGRIFRAKRKWQKFATAACRRRHHRGSVVYIPVAKRQKRPAAPSKTHLSARRPSHHAQALVEAAEGFARIPGRPRNFGGELTRLALSKPGARTLVRLAEVLRRDQATDRPNCRTCGRRCADGEACRRIDLVGAEREFGANQRKEVMNGE